MKPVSQQCLQFLICRLSRIITSRTVDLFVCEAGFIPCIRGRYQSRKMPPRHRALLLRGWTQPSRSHAWRTRTSSPTSQARPRCPLREWMGKARSFLSCFKSHDASPFLSSPNCAVRCMRIGLYYELTPDHSAFCWQCRLNKNGWPSPFEFRCALLVSPVLRYSISAAPQSITASCRFVRLGTGEPAELRFFTP